MFQVTGVTDFEMRNLTLAGTYGTNPNVYRDMGLGLSAVVDFRIHDVAFQNLARGIEIHGDPTVIRGVIYQNTFTDMYLREPAGAALGYGVVVYGNGTWPTVALGTSQNVFIEDNTFTRNRHAVASNNGSRYVFRYNTIIDNREDAAAIDAHGWGVWPRGSRQYEIHDNTVNNAVPRYAGVLPRGGDGVIFDNSFSSNVTFEVLLTNERGCAGTYPLPDQIRDLYIWNNALDDGGSARVFLQSGCESIVQLNRDYFTTQRPGYTPYTYPHPLRADRAPAPSDTSPPTTTPAASPAPNANGWNNTNVTITLNAVDIPGGSGVKQISFSLAGAQAGSGVVGGSSASVLIAAESVTGLTYAATDNAGNAEAPKMAVVRIDKIPPIVSATVTPQPNGGGWNNTNLTVTFAATDSLSGVASVSDPVTVTAEGQGQVISGTASDVGGNTAAASVTLNIDKTPPVVNFGPLAPAANAGGWSNTEAAISFTTADNLSGVASTSLTSPLLFATEGKSLTQEITVTDVAGNAAMFTAPPMNIDKTPPAVTCVRVARPKREDGDDRGRLLFEVTATDGLSGVATIALGDVRLTNPEIIQVQPTRRPGVQAVVKKDDDDDRNAPRIRRFRVGPAAAVIKATDEAGNVGTAVCPLPLRHDDDNESGDDRGKGRDRRR